MRYSKFHIENYRAIKGKLTVDLSSRIIPLVGVNECGKTTILQAIFCFDYYNDEENKGYHLQNIDNLYRTVSDGDCIISAEITCTREDLVKCVQNAIREKEKAIATEAAKAAAAAETVLTTTPVNPNTPVTPPAPVTPKKDANIELMEQFVESKGKITSIIINRNISKKGRYYSCDLFDEMSLNDGNLICRKIINALPYILYNDDFNDRPVNSISLEEKERDSWYDIFERVFNSTNKDYTLASILDNDERRRKSILSDVEFFLGNTLTEAWSKFSPEKKQISISLEMEADRNALEIYIKEQPKGMPERFFKITDRSKGFIWYYNFIMKIRFNPKQTEGVQKETIFLLDEPGSYLHETAQADLCKKLSDIAKKEGFVIYCTHSPQLLLPQIIPLNNILIVEKQKGTDIGVTPVSIKNNTSSKRKTAMQPIYEALQLPEYEVVGSEKKILCVEGIYDKYCIESFCTIPTDIRLFPSVSAGSIVQNIPYFIAYQKKYMALWDNDPEGRKKQKQAREHFGEVEGKNFALLPDRQSKGKVMMEDMIALSDYDLLRTSLNLSDDADYNTIVSTLYFLSGAKRAKIVQNISQETKDNFNALQSVIDKHLGVVKTTRKSKASKK